MKTRVLWLVIAILMTSMMLTSCMNHISCAAYDSVKGRSATMASTKKSKPAKNRTPYYKSMKQAEKD